MASIRTRTSKRDGTVTYQLQYRYQGKQPSIEFADYESALRWQRRFADLGAATALRMLSVETDGGQYVRLKDAGEDFITNLTGVGDGQRTRYRAYMRNDVEKFFGEHAAVDQITDKDVRRWVNWLEQTRRNAPKTIANKHGFLFPLMASLHKAGVIPVNPCADTKLPRVDQAEMCFLEPDEFAALYEALPAQWRPLVKFLVATGARWGEVTAIKVRDVDRRTSTVRICRAWKYTGGARELGAPKTRRSRRTIDLDPDFVAEMVYAPQIGSDREDWLFVNGNGGPVHVTTFYKQVWRPTLVLLAADEADPLNGKTPRIHDLRHTCASWMLDAGIPVGDVQAHLGHESIQTTSDRYGHVSRDAGRRAAAAIGSRLPNAGSRKLVAVA